MTVSSGGTLGANGATVSDAVLTVQGTLQATGTTLASMRSLRFDAGSTVTLANATVTSGAGCGSVPLSTTLPFGSGEHGVLADCVERGDDSGVDDHADAVVLSASGDGH